MNKKRHWDKLTKKEEKDLENLAEKHHLGFIIFKTEYISAINNGQGNLPYQKRLKYIEKKVLEDYQKQCQTLKENNEEDLIYKFDMDRFLPPQ